MGGPERVLGNLISAFPGLLRDGFSITSQATPQYNCIAWAAGDDHKWWWPDKLGQTYWPPGADRELSVSGFVAAYATLGFSPCENGEHEVGWEKIAIYSVDDTPTHAARQLEGGKWTSKLGQGEDITHALEGLEGSLYGRPMAFIRRRRP